MKKVFVDTVAWIALLNVDDIWHQQAKQTRLELVEQNYIFITTEFILLEVGDALCSQSLRQNTANFLQNIYQLKSTKIVTLS
jgi:predicted nucleic acid-binding protein